MNKKILMMIPTGVIALSMIIGGGTYALFRANATNSNNAFTAGTLNIQAQRNDVPFQGPMFYTTSLTGGTPTGLWAPGDKHTRGLFLKNTGSLAAKLATLTAKPADSSGNVVSIGTDFDNDTKFAQQANVLIWQVRMYDPLRLKYLTFSDMDATDMNKAMEVVNAAYQAWAKANPNKPADQYKSLLLSQVNRDLLNSINNLTGTSDGQRISNATLQVVQLTSESLSTLVSNSSDVKNMNINVDPRDAALLAFTVDMDLQPPISVDKNSAQGNAVYFNFGTDWQQSRNN